MKSYNIYGLGNALVDIIVQVTDEEFAALNMEKATMRLVEPAEQLDLLKKFSGKKLQMASAGSVANSIYTVGQLGGKAAFSGAIGDDQYGLFYKNEFESLDIEFPSAPLVGGITGTCLVLITPDAERTMRTCLATSSAFSSDHIIEDIVRRSEWIFLEGYLLSNPANVKGAISRMIELAKKHNTKIAFTCSEAWVVQSFKDLVDEVLNAADLVFANESEACALSGGSNAEEAFQILKKRFSYTAVTAGEKGAYASTPSEEVYVPAFNCNPIDLTGAGDAFAGGLLFGMTQNYSLKQSVIGGTYLASKVIAHVGARYPADMKDLWNEVIA